MKKLIACLALVVMAQSVPADEPARHHADHDHHVEVIQVGQQQWFIAVCSRNDLNVRFNNINDARRAADDHARATGHNTGVIRG
ncbi:MAG: hypothetical protein KF760_07110 [Candidatus Eremiobacteraeota bacterium]|nr:hypothetical protein [Candidatus Eremiobacteraeota bacterium]MCW5872567.1 hypothetical protein [Candidatus Eremiobacteraeota bacterium]